MQDAKRQLERYQIRPSHQRLSILSYLRMQKTHPTAEMIHRALSPMLTTLSLTTVYNTLHLMSEKGAIRALQIDDKQERFDADLSQHGHFMCRHCSKVYDVEYLPMSVGTHIEGHELKESHQFHYGVCKHCRDRESLS